jgi:hypothetical protein
MNPYSKMIGAFFGAALGGVGTAMLDGNFTQAELIVATGASLVAAAGTFVVPKNTPAS